MWESSLYLFWRICPEENKQEKEGIQSVGQNLVQLYLLWIILVDTEPTDQTWQ